MKIIQNTFKENKENKENMLNFGMKGSLQRNTIFEYRNNTFKDSFLEDFPEIYLKLPSEAGDISRKVYFMHGNISFKYIGTLAVCLAYNRLENTTAEEFEILIKRFKNHLHHNSYKTRQELRKYF